MAGYGQRLGATFAGGYTHILIGDALLPSLLHQGPRYFCQGTGTTRSCMLHAFSNAIFALGDAREATGADRTSMLRETVRRQR